MNAGKLLFLLSVVVVALLPSVAAGVNTPPEIDPAVPNLIVRNTNPSFTVDLTPFEFDAEDPDPQLTWAISGFDTALYSASVDPDDVLTITPVAGEVGSDSALLTLSDGALDDTQTIGITIDQGPVTVALSGDEMTVGAETVYLWQFDSVQVNNAGQVMFYANSKLGSPGDGSPEGPCVIAYGDGSSPPTLMVADGDPVPTIAENAEIEPGSQLFICDPGLPGAFSASDPQFNNDGGIAFLATVDQPTQPDIEAIFYKASAIDPAKAVAVGGQSCPSGLPLGGTLTPLFAFVIIDMDSKINTNVLYRGLCDYPAPPDLEFMAVGQAGSNGTKFIAEGELAPGGAGGTITIPVSGSLAGAGTLRASGAAGCSAPCGGGGGGKIIVSGEPGTPPAKVVITGDTWFSGEPVGDVTFTDFDITIPPIILPDDSVIFQATASAPYGSGYFVRNADGTTEKLVLENDPAYAGGSIGPITFGGGGGGGWAGGGGNYGAVVVGISDSYDAGDPAFQRVTAYPSGELIDYVGEPLDGGNSIGAILSTHVSDDGSQSGSTAEAGPLSCPFSSCQATLGKPIYAVIIDEGDGISWLDEGLSKCGIDADGDGSLDWSFDLDRDGNCDVDPHRPDIFVEIDYMSCMVAPVDVAPADSDPDDDLPADCMEDGASTCDDGLDNGPDGYTDDADPDCHTDGNASDFATYNGTFSEDGVTACNDGLDNGPDGYTDDADPDCHVHMPTGVAEDGITGVYSCEDGIDPDGDNPEVINGQIDLNVDATVDGSDTGSIAGVAIIAGGVDINGDGSVDSSDDGSLIGFNVTDGGIDVDEDGFITTSDNGSLGELGDPDCSVVAAFANAPVHNPTSDEDDIATCEDGVDNGGPAGPDGKTDTADEDCHTDRNAADPGTYDPKLAEDLVYGTCNDSLDNGSDGKTDAEDPDCTGVDLHVFIDEAIAHAKYLDFPGGGSTPCTGPMGGLEVTDEGTSPPKVKIRDFNEVKGSPNASPPAPVHFGTAWVRSLLALSSTSTTAYVNPFTPNPVQTMAARIAARFQVTHYVLSTHRQAPFDGNSSGCGEMPGNDFYVSLGGWNLNGTTGQRDGTFMHELGHNLNLCHGGPIKQAQSDGQCNVNYKPNYLSVMNYTFQMPTTRDGQATGRPLDYSRWELPPIGITTCASAIVGYLNESGLDEGCGIDNNNPPASPSGFSAWNTAYTYVLSGRCPFQVTSATGSIDWDKDLTIGSNVSANINDPGNCTDTEREPLNGYVDWDDLLYNIAKTAGYADGMPHGPVVPETGPPGDSDGDGVMDALDDAPGVASADFSDTALGGNTLGQIVSGAVSITDADNPDDGVLLFASEASTVSMCSDFATIDLEELGAVVATCGSAEVTIIQGPADVRFGPVFTGPDFFDPPEGCYTATVQTGSRMIIVDVGPPADAMQVTHAVGSANVSIAAPNAPPMNPHSIAPGQVRQDSEADCVFGSVDNCPADSNRDQTNTDFDLNGAGATVNSVAIPTDGDGDACDDDDDNDSFNGTTVATQNPGPAAACPGGSMPIWADCIESYLGTTINDNCTGSPGAGGDAWPVDINQSGTVSGGDVFAIFPFWLTSVARYDLDATGTVSGGDVFAIFPWWLASCN